MCTKHSRLTCNHKRCSWRLKQCTIGPQPDLARHQGFRRLVANVFNACQTAQKCPPITNMATFFRCHVQFSRYRSEKSELWNNHWKQVCGSRKVSTNRCSKTPTIGILKCYWGAWGHTLVDWNSWLHFWGIKCFLFLFRMCHAVFREWYQKSRFTFSSAMFVNADLLSPPGSSLYYITIAFPY